MGNVKLEHETENVSCDVLVCSNRLLRYKCFIEENDTNTN